MIAMQYDIGLPADYDMAIIRRRIADKGHLTDDFPGLAFKAYLYCARDDRKLVSGDNRYAPFYAWHDNEGMNAFLCGAGFATLARDFGRPSVRMWSAWQTAMTDDLDAAVYATCEVLALPRYAALDAHRQMEAEATRDAIANGALAAVVAFEAVHWTLVRFRLWSDIRVHRGDSDSQSYHVGHVSQPRHHR